MSNKVISVENLSKQYHLGTIGTGTFYNDLKIWWAKQRGKPNPLAKIDVKDYGNRNGDIVWALKDINFQVEQGEALGIIGKNGAGKSTLLKILSRVTAPTSGKIKVKGRIASLLEVGTGFHPELTGRENIYLNGAILGMSREEVNRKLDEIIAFSGVEKYIDTPVKRYSSGMYVRLAFAVAAHLEPEILVVDEVLAVGDAEFQKKCLGKMSDVANEGRTVLFVSHNMGAVRKLCRRGILIDKGTIAQEGEISEIIERYTNVQTVEQAFAPIFVEPLNLTISNITINKQEENLVLPFKPMKIDIEIDAQTEVSNIGLQILITKNSYDGILFSTNTKQNKDMNITLQKGKNIITCYIDQFNLCTGNYQLGFAIDQPNVRWYYFNFSVLNFEVGEALNGLMSTLPNYSHFYMNHSWSISH